MLETDLLIAAALQAYLAERGIKSEIDEWLGVSLVAAGKPRGANWTHIYLNFRDDGLISAVGVNKSSDLMVIAGSGGQFDLADPACFDKIVALLTHQASPVPAAVSSLASLAPEATQPAR